MYIGLIPEASLDPQRGRDSGEHAQSATPRPRFVRPKYSTGDKIIRWFSYLHFGNFGGWPSKAIWVGHRTRACVSVRDRRPDVVEPRA